MHQKFSTRTEQTIANNAARYCREELQKKGWSANSSGSIKPVWGDGTVGLDTTVDYVRFQNNGIKPFLMRWVAGRVIPIKDATGTHFVRGKDVGEPGWVTLPGGVRKWRDQKWRHPGLKGEHFMEAALRKAIKE